MEGIFEKIMEVERKGRYDLIYQKAQQFEGRTSKPVITFGIEDNHRITLRIWKKIYTRIV